MFCIEIINDEDYTKALERVDLIFNAEINSEEGKELSELLFLIKKYEDEKYPILKSK
jgi:HTH-type transcriptional regulator/antitoxin HigA